MQRKRPTLEGLWTCGRVLRTSPSPTGRVDSPMDNIPVVHRLPTLSGFSPAASTRSADQVFQSQDLRVSVHSLGPISYGGVGSVLASVESLSASLDSHGGEIT